MNKSQQKRVVPLVERRQQVVCTPQGIIEQLLADLPEMEALCCVWLGKDGDNIYVAWSECRLTTALGLAEVLKDSILRRSD